MVEEGEGRGREFGLGLGDVIEGSVLREECRLGLGKFEHVGCEVGRAESGRSQPGARARR